MLEILQALTVLFIVCAIIAMSYFFTRWLGRGMVAGGRRGAVRIIDRAPLSQDKSVALVSVGERYFLIGVASGGISLISELSGDDVAAFMVEDRVTQDVPSAFMLQFTELLKKAAGKKDKE